MYKVGVLSDTHGMLRPEVLEALQGCEAILHGGDINKREILDDLEKIAPVQVVRGNNDKEWAEQIPEKLTLDVCGVRIFMVHNKKFIPKELTGIDLVIYGHSHKYEEKKVGDVLYLNPGSCGPRRFNQEITLALLYIEDDRSFRIEKVWIPHPERKTKKAEEEKIPKNLAAMLPAIMKEIDAGKTVKQIAKKHHISEELSEQVNRMYLTHPGVDVEGILRRLGI